MKRYWIVSLCLLMFSSLGFAAKAPTLTPAEYKALTAVQKLMEEEKWKPARTELYRLADVLTKPYANALRLQTLGQVELQFERYPQALKALDAAYQLQVLTAEQQLQMLHVRAQLSLTLEKWKSGAKLLEQWIAESNTLKPGLVKAQDYLWLAQAYSQLENWKKAISRVRIAISMRKDAPENWHQLELAGHLNLKQWKSALTVLQRLIAIRPNKENYWEQTVSLQLQLKRTRQALATLRVAYERNVLKKGANQKLLAQLMLQYEMPYQAAQVLHKAMDKKLVKSTSKNLRTLASAWSQAREQKNALKTLQQLAKRKATPDLLGRIARLQVAQKQWTAAENTLKRALKLKPKHPERLLLLQGIARIRMERLDEAKQSFQSAQQYKSVKGVAGSWLNYLQQIAQAG